MFDFFVCLFIFFPHLSVCFMKTVPCGLNQIVYSKPRIGVHGTWWILNTYLFNLCVNKLSYVLDVGAAVQGRGWTCPRSGATDWVSGNSAGLVFSPDTASNLLFDFKSVLHSLIHLFI